MSVVDGHAPKPFLQLASMNAGYGDTAVLRDITLEVPEGQITALIGPNGAGKTTLLKVAAGLLRASAGEVLIEGADVDSLRPARRSRLGLCLLPEGRAIFPRLSVRENLLIQIPPWNRKQQSVDAALDFFPILRDRLRTPAGSLSGGQQQILALCRCYLASPRVILLDELSTGLAPRLVDQIFGSVKLLAAGGVGVLLVEQYVTRALELADRVVLLNKGRVAFDKDPSEVDRIALVRDYLGSADATPLHSVIGNERGASPTARHLDTSGVLSVGLPAGGLLSNTQQGSRNPKSEER